MAENETPAPAPAAPSQPQMRILGQFIRDMSFENIIAQKGAPSDSQPDVQVQVNLDAKKREPANQYESAIKLTVTSKDKGSDTTIFVLEIDYVGIFHATYKLMSDLVMNHVSSRSKWFDQFKNGKYPGQH